GGLAVAGNDRRGGGRLVAGTGAGGEVIEALHVLGQPARSVSERVSAEAVTAQRVSGAGIEEVVPVRSLPVGGAAEDGAVGPWTGVRDVLHGVLAELGIQAPGVTAEVIAAQQADD